MELSRSEVIETLVDNDANVKFREVAVGENPIINTVNYSELTNSELTKIYNEQLSNGLLTQFDADGDELEVVELINIID